MSALLNTLIWHTKARPTPTDKDFNIQTGCMIEEVLESIEELTTKNASGLTRLNGVKRELSAMANDLKSGKYQVSVRDDIEFLDGLCDVIVTVAGVAHAKGYNIIDAMAEVNASNDSKFENGQPVFDDNGKIIKGKDYFKPDLSEFI